MSILNKALDKAKGFVKKNFIEPSRKVHQMNTRTDALNKAKAKSGSFNKSDHAKPTY